MFAGTHVASFTVKEKEMRHHTGEHLLYADTYEYDLIFNQFNKFIFHCISSFYRSIGRKCPQDEKEDIFQEVALKILKNDYVRRYDKTRSSMTTWLGMITRTTAIDHLRKRREELAALDAEPEASGPGMESLVEPLPLPAGVLTPRQEEVLQLGFRDGLRATEIAAKLGISPRTARSIKFQALERLRTHFGLHEGSRHRRTQS